MKYKIPLGAWKPTETERANIGKVMDSGQLSYGCFSQKLEGMWSQYHNCKYGVLSNSGTSSLHVALLAMKELYCWPDGAEVLVPAITFIASVNAILHAGLKPVLCDVKIHGMIDPDEIAAKTTENTKCLMLCHLWGVPHPEKRKILEVCAPGNLKIIEDSCETVSREVGNWGDVSCFSMYMSHIVNAGVGGMACTNDSTLADIMRSLVNHGTHEKLLGVFPSFNRWSFIRQGFSYRITEFEAALATAQFEDIDNTLKLREERRDWLSNAFIFHGANKTAKLIGGLMMYAIVINEGSIKNTLMNFLDSCGIEVRNMMPITNQAVIRDVFPEMRANTLENFPTAHKINNCGFYVPINLYMTESDCDFVAVKLAEGLKTCLVNVKLTLKN